MDFSENSKRDCANCELWETRLDGPKREVYSEAQNPGYGQTTISVSYDGCPGDSE